MRSAAANQALPPKNAPLSPRLYEDIEYPGFWESRDMKMLDDLEQDIVGELLPARGRRLLDLGSGYGRLAPTYIRRFDAVVLFDGSLSLLHSARMSLGENAVYVAGDINCLPFAPESFDAVLMVRVFHHLSSPRSCLESIRTLLCGGGRLVMSYSNKRNAYRVLKFLAGAAPRSPFTLEPLDIEPNFIHHHPRSVARMLAESGFSPSCFRGSGAFDRVAAAWPILSRSSHRGVRLAPLLGLTFLAPWIFCRCGVRKSRPLRPDRGLAGLFVCPACRGKLVGQDRGYACPACLREYPVRDGIIDMRLDGSGERRAAPFPREYHSKFALASTGRIR